MNQTKQKKMMTRTRQIRELKKNKEKNIGYHNNDNDISE